MFNFPSLPSKPRPENGNSCDGFENIMMIKVTCVLGVFFFFFYIYDDASRVMLCYVFITPVRVWDKLFFLLFLLLLLLLLFSFGYETDCL